MLAAWSGMWALAPQSQSQLTSQTADHRGGAESQHRPTGHPSHLLTVLAGTAATLEPQNHQTLEPFGMSCYSFAPLQIWKRRQEKATNMQVGQTRSTISCLPLITWSLSLSMGTLRGLSQFHKVPAGNPVSWAEPLARS